MDNSISHRYRPLRGLDYVLVLNPGADAPGFMLTSAPRILTSEYITYLIPLISLPLPVTDVLKLRR